MGALMGVHTFAIVITLNDFPEFDTFITGTSTFDLTITSACTTNAIISPSPD
jgi:hypothetical protein